MTAIINTYNKKLNYFFRTEIVKKNIHGKIISNFPHYIAKNFASEEKAKEYIEKEPIPKIYAQKQRFNIESREWIDNKTFQIKMRRLSNASDKNLNTTYEVTYKIDGLFGLQ